MTHHQTALGPVEIFRVSKLEAMYNQANIDHANEYTILEEGWYWWVCHPGCLPDSPPAGPFETEMMALENAEGDQQKECAAF